MATAAALRPLHCWPHLEYTRTDYALSSPVESDVSHDGLDVKLDVKKYVTLGELGGKTITFLEVLGRCGQFMGALPRRAHVEDLTLFSFATGFWALSGAPGHAPVVHPS